MIDLGLVVFFGWLQVVFVDDLCGFFVGCQCQVDEVQFVYQFGWVDGYQVVVGQGFGVDQQQCGIYQYVVVVVDQGWCFDDGVDLFEDVEVVEY